MVEYENTDIINLMDSPELVSLNEGSLLLATDIEVGLFLKSLFIDLLGCSWSGCSYMGQGIQECTK